MKSLILLSALFPLLCQAAPKATVGKRLPNLVLSGDDEGLMRLSGDDVSYGNFSSGRHIPGKVRAVIYMAGRSDAKAKGKAFIKALNAEKWPKNFRAMTIMDVDDCTFGTCSIAKGKLEDRQRQKRGYNYVIDEDGKGRKAWGLKKENFTVFITDASGNVVKFHEGKISGAAAADLIGAIKTALAPPAAVEAPKP